jgi:HEAT repeat protein
VQDFTMSRFVLSSLLLGLFASTAAAQDKTPRKEQPDFEGIKALKHSDPDVRYNAAQRLVDVGPAAKFAAGAVQEQLKEEKVIWVRVKLVEALWNIDKPSVQTLMPTLLEALKDEKSEVARANACSVIGQFGALGKPGVSALAKALNDKDPAVRAEAAMALGEIGPAARAAIGALLEALKPAEVNFAEPFILTALGKIGEPAIPALKVALTAKEYRLRRGAAYALAMIGPAAAETIDPLAKMLTAPEADLRSLAARALGKIGKEAKPVAPEILKLLDDSSPQVRIAAAVSLWEIDGNVAGKPALVGALKNSSVRVREQACRACAEVAGSPVVPMTTLTERLKDAAPAVRKLAAEALGAAGTKVTDALPDLKAALKDADGLVRVAAALAVWQIDKSTKESVTLLATWLTDAKETDRTRKEAAIALGQMGPDARPAANALYQVFRDSDNAAPLRRAAAIALRKVEAKK